MAMARKKDIALAMSVMAGPDGVDIYAPPVPVPDYMDMDPLLSRLKVGWTPTGGIPVVPEVADSVAKAAEAFSELGLDVEQTEIPGLVERDADRISAVILVHA